MQTEKPPCFAAYADKSLFSFIRSENGNLPRNGEKNGGFCRQLMKDEKCKMKYVDADASRGAASPPLGEFVGREVVEDLFQRVAAILQCRFELPSFGGCVIARQYFEILPRAHLVAAEVVNPVRESGLLFRHEF